MLLDILLVIGSVAVLAGGAEALVGGSVSLAKRLGLSSFFIGLTIVGFGTSTPELSTGVSAALRGASDVNVGNVVGSNIFNVAVILGVAALIAPIPVVTRLVRREAPVVVGVALVPFVTLASGGVLTRPIGAALVLALLVYLALAYRTGRREEAPASEGLPGIPEAGRKHPLVALAMVVVGLAMLVFGSTMLVDSSVRLARAAGVSELLIALTIVSAGTSTPELFTSVVAAFRKQSDVAIGNIFGSNIFNVLGILGVSSIVSPQRVNEQVLRLDAPMMLLLSVACLPVMLSGARISRVEGGALLVGYAIYLTALLMIAA